VLKIATFAKPETVRLSKNPNLSTIRITELIYDTD